MTDETDQTDKTNKTHTVHHGHHATAGMFARLSDTKKARQAGISRQAQRKEAREHAVEEQQQQAPRSRRSRRSGGGAVGAGLRLCFQLYPRVEVFEEMDANEIMKTRTHRENLHNLRALLLQIEQRPRRSYGGNGRRSHRLELDPAPGRDNNWRQQSSVVVSLGGDHATN